MIVGTPDAHVDAVVEVGVPADLDPIVQVLQVGVDHDLRRVADVLLDRLELVMSFAFRRGVHPVNLNCEIN